MSEFKNHYGDNVAWFCYEASLIDADFQHDDMIPDVLEIICDNGGSIDIDVRKLFESAHVVIEKQEDEIKDLKENATTATVFKWLAEELEKGTMEILYKADESGDNDFVSVSSFESLIQEFKIQHGN
ncbi:hypothetical protein V8068_001163 [Vibrio parahaemolyticus]